MATVARPSRQPLNEIEKKLEFSLVFTLQTLSLQEITAPTTETTVDNNISIRSLGYMTKNKAYFMKATEQTVQQIERTIRKTAQKFPADSETSILTDIHIKVSPDSGEMITYDDDDQEINRCVVEQWIDCTDDDFYSHVTTLLTHTLKRMSETVDAMGIMKPFSIILEDDDRCMISDLYLADDDTVIIGEDLMQGLDSDLDSFFDKLMRE